MKAPPHSSHEIKRNYLCNFPETEALEEYLKTFLTRLHSSRMRTARALTVSPSMLSVFRGVCSGGVGGSAWGGVCSWGMCLLRGVSAPGGCLLPGLVSALGGVSAPGGCIPACTEANTPLWTESQTPVKTLPCPNFVAGGN